MTPRCVVNLGLKYFRTATARLINVLMLCLLVAGFQSHSKLPTRLLSTRSFCERKVKPTVEIEYCTGCRWLLRSAYYAQELLTTFESDIEKVSLKPNSDKPGGAFIISVDNLVIWDRKNESTPGFPETKVLKQIIRDQISPARDLGHSERKSSNPIIEVREGD
jgi:selenoprotein W-related protein